jgi:ParB-like chromosome segregation protein Spo0J
VGIIEVKEMQVTDLKFAPYNPRKMSEQQMERLKKSILENGIVDPLVYNQQTGHVVGGNQRLAALIDLEIEHVWVAVIDVSIEREQALNIALNKITGEWDIPKLKDLLVELDTGAFDIELTGFDQDEIAGLVAGPYNSELPGSKDAEALKIDILCSRKAFEKMKSTLVGWEKELGIILSIRG